MKVSLLILLLLVQDIFSQDLSPVSAGTIVVVPNQKLSFKNLKVVDQEVVFINLETNTQFRYLIKMVKQIFNAEGKEVFRNEQLITAVLPKPKEKGWLTLTSESIDKRRPRAEIILKSGDTLKKYLKVRTSVFDRTDINPVSLQENVIYYDDETKKVLPAEQISKLIVVDLKGSERVFVNLDKTLIEQRFDGKAKWYRFYYEEISGALKWSDIIVNDFGETSVVNTGFSMSKNLKKVLASRPDIFPLIDSANMAVSHYESSMYRILKKYNE